MDHVCVGIIMDVGVEKDCQTVRREVQSWSSGTWKCLETLFWFKKWWNFVVLKQSEISCRQRRHKYSNEFHTQLLSVSSVDVCHTLSPPRTGLDCRRYSRAAVNVRCSRPAVTGPRCRGPVWSLEIEFFFEIEFSSGFTCNWACTTCTQTQTAVLRVSNCGKRKEYGIRGNNSGQKNFSIFP